MVDRTPAAAQLPSSSARLSIPRPTLSPSPAPRRHSCPACPAEPAPSLEPFTTLSTTLHCLAGTQGVSCPNEIIFKAAVTGLCFHLYQQVSYMILQVGAHDHVRAAYALLLLTRTRWSYRHCLPSVFVGRQMGPAYTLHPCNAMLTHA